MTFGSNQTVPKHPFLSRAWQYLPRSAWSHCNTAAGPGSIPAAARPWTWTARVRAAAGQPTRHMVCLSCESRHWPSAFSWMFEEYLHASQSSVKEKHEFVRKTEQLFLHCSCAEVCAHMRCTVPWRDGAEHTTLFLWTCASAKLEVLGEEV